MAAAIDFDALEWEPLGASTRQKRIVAGSCAVRLLQFDADFQETEWCRKAHFGFVVSGSLRIEFANRTERLAAGDGLAIPGGPSWEHRALVPEDGATLFLVEPL
jgi:hypothetical protein